MNDETRGGGDGEDGTKPENGDRVWNGIRFGEIRMRECEEGGGRKKEGQGRRE